MTDKAKCFRCEVDGVINRRTKTHRELRAMGPNEEMMCYPCVMSKDNSNEEVMRLSKRLQEMDAENDIPNSIDLSQFIQQLVKDGGESCDLPDCPGCHPENFKDGKFHKEGMH